MSDEIIHLTSCGGNLFTTFPSGKTRAGVRAGLSSPDAHHSDTSYHFHQDGQAAVSPSPLQ